MCLSDKNKRFIQKAFHSFKYLSVVFTIGYLTYAAIDDYHLYKKYWTAAWQEYLIFGTLYFVIYYVLFALLYWSLVLLMLLIRELWNDFHGSGKRNG